MAALKYKAGEYLEAANELNLAYSLQPQPVFLFNIAQAYRKGRASRAAKEMYQRFVEVAPTHPLAPEARGYIQDECFGLPKNIKILRASGGHARAVDSDPNTARGAPTSKTWTTFGPRQRGSDG